MFLLPIRMMTEILVPNEETDLIAGLMPRICFLFSWIFSRDFFFYKTIRTVIGYFVNYYLSLHTFVPDLFNCPKIPNYAFFLRAPRYIF